MKKIICDVCGEEITPADIHYTFNVDIDDKIVEQLDMHAICFIYFKKAAKELKESEEVYTVTNY